MPRRNRPIMSVGEIKNIQKQKQKKENPRWKHKEKQTQWKHSRRQWVRETARPTKTTKGIQREQKGGIKI